MKRGILLSFEGTEGSGKSTLITCVFNRLDSLGYKTLITREPGGTPLAEHLRALVLNPPYGTPSALTELLLLEAARADHVSRVIRPALEQGQIVLCDRFTDSTLAYQSQARGLAWNPVHRVNLLATEQLKPDLVVFLDIDPALGLARAKDPNRFEREGVLFQTTVRKGFLKARAQAPQRWLTLRPAKSTPDELALKVLQKIKPRLGKLKS